MKSKQQRLGFMGVLILAAALVLVPGFSRTASAASEDVAMFYDDLSQMGQWFEYENYGPVWQPSNVDEEWRPYTNGRWTPTNDGYVFESQEPWGWATYHYGNWMPTQGYGWVWVPGRTWYPSTVEWRTSPETAPVDTSYVGWAPIPPPNYMPPPSYAPAAGYYPGAPVADALTEPLWIFVRAASFLLGLGQPYAPAYSYYGCGCLAPPVYVPTFFPQTVIVPNYVVPTYYPATLVGPGVVGAYNWGPPVTYVSRVTNISQVTINKTINYNSVNITKINNVVAPTTVINRNPHIRNITPPNLVQGRPLPPPNKVTNIKLAQANLGKPNIVAPVKGLPPLQANIPRVTPVSHQPGRGVPGAGLPTSATQRLTPQMEQRVKQLPPNKQLVPVKATPVKQVLGPQPGVPGKPGVPPTGSLQPGVTGRPGEVKPGVPGKPGQVQPGVFGKPGVPPTGPGQPGVTGKPGQVQPGVTTRPGATPAVPGKPGPATPAVPPQPATAKPGATPAVPGKPGPATPAVPPATAGKPGELRPGQPGYKPPTTGPGFVQPGTTPKPGTPTTQQQQQQQRQREQQVQQQRQQQLQQQQQRQREQQMQQQRLQQQQREQQVQQQRQREQQMQQQRQREQQMQQQRQREQQMQQQRQQQLQQQQQRQREQQLQQQRLQQQQQQQQQRIQQQRQQQQQQQQKQQEQQKKKQQEQQQQR
jgi:hypothetical protein